MQASFEIVRVITATQLIDSESYQRTLGTAHVDRLQPGFYVVLWTSQDSVLRYDESAAFVGPFDSRVSAELACEVISNERLGEEVHCPSTAVAPNLVSLANSATSAS
jgi:hypothetical protein